MCKSVRCFCCVNEQLHTWLIWLMAYWYHVMIKQCLCVLYIQCIYIYFLICSIMNTIRLIQQILFVLLNKGNLTIVLFSSTANLAKENLIHLGFNKFNTFQKDLIKIILYSGKLKLYCTVVASSDFKFFTKSKKKILNTIQWSFYNITIPSVIWIHKRFWNFTNQKT